MSEEINYILESLRFKTSIYRDAKKRNLTFNDDEYYSNILIEYIEQLQRENQRLKQWDKNKDTRNSRQRVANYELLKENQQLKDRNKLLEKHYTQLEKDYGEELGRNIVYKSVLNEIREYIKEQLKFCENDSQGAYEICNLTISKYKHLLQILDKVGKE